MSAMIAIIITAFLGDDVVIAISRILELLFLLLSRQLNFLFMVLDLSLSRLPKFYVILCQTMFRKQG